MKNVAAPCTRCPFRRDSEPGYLGSSEWGAKPEVFVGQVAGPFRLPCHQTYETREQALVAPQCAGAAAFRANTGLDVMMPPGIHRLPQNPRVFDSAAQFMAHHDRTGIAQAQQKIAAYGGIAGLVRIELSRSGVVAVPSKEEE